MHKDYDQYKTEAIEAIKKHKILRFYHLFAGFVSFSRSTAHKIGLDKDAELLQMIDNNRAKGVNYMLQKWINSENPTLQIAAMRIIATKEERMALNQRYIEHSVDEEMSQENEKIRDTFLDYIKKNATITK